MITICGVKYNYTDGVLDISIQNLDDIPPEVYKLKYLTDLDISFNNL